VYYSEEKTIGGLGPKDWSGWYYIPKDNTLSWHSCWLGAELTDNLKEQYNIPNLAVVDLKANADGASINMMFG
jgi:hypothetical protein